MNAKELAEVAGWFADKKAVEMFVTDKWVDCDFGTFASRRPEETPRNDFRVKLKPPKPLELYCVVDTSKDAVVAVFVGVSIDIMNAAHRVAGNKHRVVLMREVVKPTLEGCSDE